MWNKLNHSQIQNNGNTKSNITEQVHKENVTDAIIKEEKTEVEVSMSSFDSLETVFDIESLEINNGNLSGNESSNDGIRKGKKQEQDKLRKENVTDAIIKAFTVKRRKAMIDEEDNDDDNVDYETSERRLIILAIILAFIFIIFATIMTSFLAKQLPKTSFIIRQLTMEEESQFPLVPHLALLFSDGSMEIYEFSTDNAKLNHAWSFKVPQQKATNTIGFNTDNEYKEHQFEFTEKDFQHIPGHILLILKGDIFIFDMGGKTDTTVLTTNGKSQNNLTHFTIRQSKIPIPMLYDSRYSQAGNEIWIMGGSNQVINYNSASWHKGLDCNTLVMEKVIRKTLIWNLKRQTYYPGPKLPFKAMGKGCPITLNRTHVLILYTNQNKQSCLDAWMYSFEEFQWTHMNECFYAPPNSTLLRFDLMCASYLDKSMNRKILVGLNAVNALWCYGEYFNLLGLDLETKKASLIDSDFNQFSSKY